MAAEDVPADMRGEPAEHAQSARPPARASRRLSRIASILLVVGAAAQIVTWSLPWVHVGALGNQPALDLNVYTVITLVPLSELIPTFSQLLHPTLATIIWDVLWQGSLIFIGLLLVLAFFSAKRPVIRWSLAVLYGLWLAYTTVLALDFVKTVLDIDNGLSALPPGPAWWTPYIQVMVTVGDGGHFPVAVSPAWGFWLFVGALVMCWLALSLTVYTLIHSEKWSSTRAKRARTQRARKLPLATMLVTVGAVVWIASFVALPMVVADCGKPLISQDASELPGVCADNARVYPLQVSEYSYTLDPLPLAPSSSSPAAFYSPGNQFLLIFIYLRDFALLVLVMAATPLALVAVWRARATRGQAVWLSVWAVVALAETGFLLSMIRELTSPTAPLIARSFFAESIGPAAVLMPLGVALILAGVALYWRETLRHEPGAAPAVGVVSQAA